jgi:hypothetical protein
MGPVIYFVTKKGGVMKRFLKLCAILALMLGIISSAKADEMVLHNKTDQDINFLIRCQSPARDWHSKTLEVGYKYTFNTRGRCDEYGIKINTRKRGALTSVHYRLLPGADYNIRYDNNIRAFNVFRR